MVRRQASDALLPVLTASVAALLLCASARSFRGSVVLVGNDALDRILSTDANPTQVYEQELKTLSSASYKRQYSRVLQDIKEQQAVAEAQTRHLAKSNRVEAEKLHRALDGDSFTQQLTPTTHSAAAIGQIKAHLHSGLLIAANSAVANARNAAPAAAAASKAAGEAAAVGTLVNKGENSRSASPRMQADGRLAKLLVIAKAQLNRDVHSTMGDLSQSASIRVKTPGGEVTVHVPENADFDLRQAMRLARDSRRVEGDKRLTRLLERMQAQSEHASAEVRARQQGVADVINTNGRQMKSAGVKVFSKPTDFGLGGMEAIDEDKGSRVLQNAGIRTDALPGLGSQYAKAIPLPFFDELEVQKRRVSGLGHGHRAVSDAGDKMMHRLKVNVASPNVLMYGDEASSTPRVDRMRDESGDYAFFDGLEDKQTASTQANLHKPLTFMIRDPASGSGPLQNKGKVNVNGEWTWNGWVSHLPQLVTDWRHPVSVDTVKAQHARGTNPSVSTRKIRWKWRPEGGGANAS